MKTFQLKLNVFQINFDSLPSKIYAFKNKSSIFNLKLTPSTLKRTTDLRRAKQMFVPRELRINYYDTWKTFWIHFFAVCKTTLRLKFYKNLVSISRNTFEVSQKLCSYIGKKESNLILKYIKTKFSESNGRGDQRNTLDQLVAFFIWLIVLMVRIWNWEEKMFISIVCSCYHCAITWTGIDSTQAEILLSIKGKSSHVGRMHSTISSCNTLITALMHNKTCGIPLFLKSIRYSYNLTHYFRLHFLGTWIVKILNNCSKRS